MNRAKCERGRFVPSFFVSGKARNIFSVLAFHYEFFSLCVGLFCCILWFHGVSAHNMGYVKLGTPRLERGIYHGRQKVHVQNALTR